MSGNLERRLGGLETTEEGRECRQVVIWRNFGQTAGEAKAARFPHGLSNHVDPVIMCWQAAAE
jgi:hypothetical protein